MERRIWSIAAVLVSVLVLLVQIVFIVSYLRRAGERDIAHAEEIGRIKGMMEELRSSCQIEIQDTRTVNRNQDAYIEDFRLRLVKAGLMK